MFVKNDQGKLRWSLIPWESLEEVLRVLEHGSKKYSDDNWMGASLSDARGRYFNAAMRHMVAWKTGEQIDPDSGYHHLAHATCCLLFLVWYEQKRDGSNTEENGGAKG